MLLFYNNIVLGKFVQRIFFDVIENIVRSRSPTAYDCVVNRQSKNIHIILYYRR